jgi:ParB family chromosome partitioning protein
VSNRTDGGRPKRGGLGRGLGALIPTAPPPPSNPPPSNQAPDLHPSSTEPARRPDEAETAPEPRPVGPPLGGTRVDRPGQDAGGPRRDAGPAEDDGGLLPVPGVLFLDLPVTAIHANAKQPRQVFDEEAMTELTHSIREFGVLQPIVVRQDTEGYELVMGERRLRAAAAAGLETIPAIIRQTADDAMLRDALLENIHRAQLNPLEEAAAYQQLLEEFGTTHDELAQRIGRSRPQVSNTIRLLNLPIPVQRRVAAGVLSAGHARALLSLDDKDKQDEIASRIVAEGLSVRGTEELVTLTLRGHAGARNSRAGSVQRITAPAITELADKLSDVFDTRVRVELGRRKGKITVEFGSINDLERLVALMAPELATPRRAVED